LDKIPVHARISVVSEGTPLTPRQVRSSCNRLRPLERLQVEKRGWTLDVLNVVHSLDSQCRRGGTALHGERPEWGRAEAAPLHQTFSLADVYAHAGSLAKLHPNNRHVRDKIRQQKSSVTSAYWNSLVQAPTACAKRRPHASAAPAGRPERPWGVGRL
jgi:type II restriction enzyme